MEAVSLKLETEFLKDIEETMKKHRYTTKTEFIREAIRDKIKKLESEDAFKRLENYFGKFKGKGTTNEAIHEAREKAFEHLVKKIKLD